MAVSTRHIRHTNIAEGSWCEDEIKETAFLDALSDENSCLSRFLFVEGGGGRGDEDAMPRLGRMDALDFALCLEPTKIRNERIVSSMRRTQSSEHYS